MKQLKILLIAFFLYAINLQAYAQQTKQPYTITIYNVNQTTGVRGTVVTANSQMLPNRIYEMTIRGNLYTPVALWVDRLYDADFGCLCGSPATWSPYSNPTQVSKDVSAGSNYTASFRFRTKSGIDFVVPMSIRARMRRSTAPAGSTPTDAVNFLIPFN